MNATALPVLQAFAAVADKKANTLILGSMPGVASLEAQQYYAHPQNAFWPIMQSLCKFDVDTTLSAEHIYETRINSIIAAGYALWDVLKSCKRPGSLDSKIERDSIAVNDFNTFLTEHAHIATIAFNGKTAEQLFRRHALPLLPDADIRFIPLPSSSPAMAMLNRDEKIALWKQRLS